MQERANYIINRFIYLGIFFVIAGMVKFVSPQSLSKFPSYFPLFIPLGIVSILFALKYKMQFKRKSELSPEGESQDSFVPDNSNRLYYLGILMAVLVGFSSHFRQQADYISGILLLVYSFWFYKEVVVLNKYLKS